MRKAKKKRGLLYSGKDLAYYILLMAFPVLQFCIFYLGVNFNSFLLTFRKYDVISNKMTFVGFDNLIKAFCDMTASHELLTVLKDSFLMYFISLVTVTPLGLFFSYYIYKKMPGSKMFRVILFLPNIVSAIVIVSIFQFFAEDAVPKICELLFRAEKMQGLIENPDTRFATVMFYNIWVGFGVTVLMYSNAMTDIPPELVESAELDGAVGLKEFYHITLPSIFPTLSTFLIVGVAGIFTNQFNLYSFFGGGSTIKTYGYWLYVRTAAATKIRSAAEYPLLSAYGIWLTLVAVPLTLIVKKLLEKFGPSED